MNIKIEEDREKLKQFYETSEDYKKLLTAHNREYLKTYIDIVIKYAKPESKILDLGAGNGLSSKMISECGHNVIGTDISYFFLSDSAKFQSANLSYCVCDALDLPFRNESFDVVCSNELIEHITDAQKSLLEMVRVLKKNGILVIMGPNLCSPFWSLIDLFNIIKGKKGRYVWAETLGQALRWGWNNLILSIKKRFSKKADFIYRKPDLVKAILGGDSDSAYYASSIDIEKFLKANGMKIIKLCESSSKKGKIMARFFPRFGLYISMVSKKANNNTRR